MKKLHSKLFAVIMSIACILPTFVKAEGFNTYKKGEMANFYISKNDKVGRSLMILEDSGEDAEYVKAFVYGIVGYTSDPYADTNDPDIGWKVDKFENTQAYYYMTKTLLPNENQMPLNDLDYTTNLETDGNLSLISLQELIDIFGAKVDGEGYVIDDASKLTIFNEIASHAKLDLARPASHPFKGIFTSTVDGNMVWAVEFINDSAGNLVKAAVKKVAYATSNEYDYAPVMYVNKKQDCNKKQTEQKYACYSCGDDYTWTTVGSQADTCTLVEKVTSKANCVKSPKTGVKEYALEFAIVAGIGIAVLTVVKRKDLFRSI